MRDPQRIEELLSELRGIWVNHPDFRLGQLIVISAHSSKPQPIIFYIEGNVLLKGLRQARAMLEHGSSQ